MAASKHPKDRTGTREDPYLDGFLLSKLKGLPTDYIDLNYSKRRMLLAKFADKHGVFIQMSGDEGYETSDTVCPTGFERDSVVCKTLESLLQTPPLQGRGARDLRLLLLFDQPPTTKGEAR